MSGIGPIRPSALSTWNSERRSHNAPFLPGPDSFQVTTTATLHRRLALGKWNASVVVSLRTCSSEARKTNATPNYMCVRFCGFRFSVGKFGELVSS